MKKTLNTSVSFMLILLFPLVIQAQEVVDQVYYENGNTKSITFKSNSEILVISYYENGNISEKSNYFDFKRDGKFQKFFENGELQLEAEYDNDKPVGNWIAYNTKGQMVGKASFDDGQILTGSIWGDDGKVIATR